MAEILKAVRGMNDLAPEASPLWRATEETIRNLLDRYGYQEIRLPLVEKTELFARGIGEGTDIVEKEMYTFKDLNGELLTLRPEGTAGCVRAGLEHGWFHHQPRRLWYSGPMFRHERPQKGRYRQFHQVGVESFGMGGPDIDAEMIALTYRLWNQLALPIPRLEINTLGGAESRTRYRKKLVEYFTLHENQLDEEAKKRLQTNPLRLLDSKNPDLKPLIDQAPTLEDFLEKSESEHFRHLLNYLDAVGIPYHHNPRLVRGLDYYTKTVFEWITDQLGAQGTICAGGRYDALIEQLGGKPTQAIGFAIGMERVITLLEQQKNPLTNLPLPDAYLIIAGESLRQTALMLAEKIRSELPTLKLVTHCLEGSLKNQMKWADKSGARYALILAEEEMQSRSLSIKDLRHSGTQIQKSWDEVSAFLQSHLV